MSDQPGQDDDVWPNDVLAHGTSLNGYRVLRLLGRGGFGVTYLVEDALGQHFALKEYFPRQFAMRHGTQVRAASAADTPVFDDCRNRFVHEARALVGLGRARFGAQDIVRVQTFFEANGTAYMVMEYIVGRTLQALLREHPTGLPAAEIRRILSDILGGLAAVHAAGLMHRDIKPANVLLRDDISAVLIDFGSARDARSQQTHGFTQIFSGGYAPPEQVMGLRQGPFSDIYAVGVIGYEAIGGKVADALTRQHAASSRQPDPMQSAAQIGAGRYDSALLGVIDAALALDPADRPDSAIAMAEALARPPPPIAPVQAAPPPPPAEATIAEMPAAESHTARPAPSHPTPGAARRWPRHAAVAAAAAIATATVAAVALLAVLGHLPFLRSPAPRPATPFAIPLPPPPSPPPVAQPVAPPPPGYDALLAAAEAQPCALLTVATGGGRVLTVTGHAGPAATIGDMLRVARATGERIDAAVEPIDPAFCPPVALLADAYRRETARDTLRLALAEPGVTVGTRFAATLQGTGGGMVQVDQYGTDGIVHHVMSRQLPSGQWSVLLQADAPGPAGQQMLVATITTGSMDLGQRPRHEPAAAYLPVLRRELDRAGQSQATLPRAEVLFFQVMP